MSSPRKTSPLSAELLGPIGPSGDSLSPTLQDRLFGKIELRRFAGPEVYRQQLSRPLRIAHITDQHVGRVTPMRIQKAAVELANQQNPDLVVLTGDFVCHSLSYLDALGEVLSGFSAPVVAVLGNHDHWSGANDVRRVLRKSGVELLDNANTTLTLGSERLQVVGIDDSYTGNADVERAVKGLRPDLPVLGLSHIAEEAEHFWAHGVPLVLSGHTHAGQVTLAKLHELAIGKIAGHRFVHGLYGSRKVKDEQGAVYVGAGIGASVMPLRLGDRGRREVTLFELGLQPGSIDEHHQEQDPLPGRDIPPELVEKRRRQAIKKALKRLKTKI